MSFLEQTDSHLHWPIILRHTNVPKTGITVLAVSTKIRNAKYTIPDNIQLENLKTKLPKQFQL